MAVSQDVAEARVLLATGAVLVLWLLVAALSFLCHRPLKSAAIRDVAILVAVIGLFAEIFVPIIRQDHDKARVISCSSNLKQLGLGLQMYVQDWDQRLPPATRWGHSTYPYVKNEQVYKCPDASSSYGYAFNRHLNLLLIEKLKEPAATVLLFEADAPTMDTSGYKSLMVPEPRHNGGDNFGFGDGHAKWFRRNSILQWQP